MDDQIHLATLLSEYDRAPEQRLPLFAWLSLGILESLTSGIMTAGEAIRLFFNAENCLFVRQALRDPTADEIMSRGVQLADLFDVLPADEGRQEFSRELTAIRDRCLALLREKRLAA